MLEWFLPIISKDYTLTRSTNHLSRNHSTMFLITKGRLAGAQNLLLPLLELQKHPYADVLQNTCS